MITSRKCYWKDIEIGRVFKMGSVSLEAAEIRAFAASFDPQPYHLDRDLAKSSIFGGLCASGWHVCALMMKLVSDCLDADRIPLLGSDQVPWLIWYSPVFEGDSISGDITITDKKIPGKVTDFGIITCDIVINNQINKKVMALTTNLMIEIGGQKDV